jgi:hypothetical protein
MAGGRVTSVKYDKYHAMQLPLHISILDFYFTMHTLPIQYTSNYLCGLSGFWLTYVPSAVFPILWSTYFMCLALPSTFRNGKP